MDVRPKHIYEKAHPVGAKNAALFRKFDVMNKPSFTGILRATALALNGVEAVEPNPDFGEAGNLAVCLRRGCPEAYAARRASYARPSCSAVQEIVAAAGGKKKVIVACEAGGTLVPSASFQYGKESRSLKVSPCPCLPAYGSHASVHCMLT